MRAPIELITGLTIGLIGGLLFGAGLIVSGMIDPRKIMAFLDVAGAWDPSLAQVMGAAVIVTFAGYRLTRMIGHPVLAPRFVMPTTRDIDRRLVGGAASFGLGWGMTGYCPAPAITALSLGESGTVVFVASMLLGMAAGRWFSSERAMPDSHGHSKAIELTQ